MKTAPAAVVVLLLAPCLAFGQQQTKPGPEIRKLGYYIGTWQGQGEVKAGVPEHQVVRSAIEDLQRIFRQQPRRKRVQPGRHAGRRQADLQPGSEAGEDSIFRDACVAGAPDLQGRSGDRRTPLEGDRRGQDRQSQI